MTSPQSAEGRTFANTAWIGIVLCAALFYAKALPLTYVGEYFDDAEYILTARWLLRGGVAPLNFLSQARPSYHLIGFPLFLAPFVALIQPHWQMLRIVPILLTLFSCFLLWKVFEAVLPPLQRLLILALYAWNGITIQFSGAIMSESLFMVLELAAFWVLFRSDDRIPLTWLGLLLGFSTIIRPEGLALCAAAALGLAARRQWRGSLRVIGWALVIWVPIFCMDALRGNGLPSYLSDWMVNLRWIAGTSLLRHVALLTLTYGAGDFLSLPMPHSQWAMNIGVTLTVFCILLGFLGVAAAARTKGFNRGIGAIFSFAVFYGLMHLLWPVMDDRFFLPLLPPFLFFLVQGAWALSIRLPRLGYTLGLCLMLLPAWYAATAGASLAFSLGTVPSLPRASFAWITNHVRQDQVIAALNPATIYLYTDRPAVLPYPFLGATPSEFRDRLQEGKIQYLFYMASNAPSSNVPSVNNLIRWWEWSRHWAASNPAKFQIAYENPAEGVAIYRVIRRPGRFRR
jgi:cadmium resistance protein CadD (predicted permease)